jgi:hypothetical protein
VAVPNAPVPAAMTTGTNSMSEMGQKADMCHMFEPHLLYPLTADIDGRCLDVRFVPQADIA